MISYTPTRENDLLLLQWLEKMRFDGDLDRTFTRSLHTPSALLTFFRPPVKLVVEYDASGVWWAFWLEPTLSSAFAGLWIAPHRRRTKQAVKLTEWALEIALRFYPVILGITCQPSLLDPHRRLGYEVVGKIPQIFDGKDAWIVCLTKEGFDARKLYRRTLKRKVEA